MKIYLVCNDINGKLYVGQTVHSIESRWKQHCTSNRCTALHSAIKKYGRNAFTVCELATASSLEELNELEESLIQDLNTLAPHGYNLRSGGLNKKHHRNSREKMSEVQKEVYKRNWGSSSPRTGTRTSLESRQRMSIAHQGKKLPKEQVEKIASKNRKPIICIQTGKVYSSIGQAAIEFGVGHQYISFLVRTGKSMKKEFSFKFVGGAQFAY